MSALAALPVASTRHLEVPRPPTALSAPLASSLKILAKPLAKNAVLAR